MRAAGRLPPPCATTLEFQMVTCLNCKYVCQPSTHVRVTFSDPFFRLVTPGETPSGAKMLNIYAFCILHLDKAPRQKIYFQGGNLQRFLPCSVLLNKS